MSDIDKKLTYTQVFLSSELRHRENRRKTNALGLRRMKQLFDFPFLGPSAEIVV